MEQNETTELTQQLITGFESLQSEYEKLFGQQRALETTLTHARDQYNELAKLLGKSTTDTPPLSSVSIASAGPKNEERPLTSLEILEIRNEHIAASNVRSAIAACIQLRQEARKRSTNNGAVKIWSGASADSNSMPNKLSSITESPMEQDFTVLGVPSKLGCPFASMTGKKLSSHAASVLSRYNGSHSPRDGQSIARDNGSIAGSTASRMNGRESLQARQSRSQRRNSLLDPIKAEICGIDNHATADKEESSQIEDSATAKGADAGVCPIRFLNQHSPEELAQYFEKHKHELPRSHEVCVRRYQSNEQQVRELDARYSDVAQMIRGLGEKHQTYLPKDPEPGAEEDLPPTNHSTDGRIEQWADSLSAQAPAAEDQEAQPMNDVVDDEEIRQSRFSRSLRDIRLGESPSRPWGIQIPAQYLEKAGSHASSVPVQITSSAIAPLEVADTNLKPVQHDAPRCPFSGARPAQPAEQGFEEAHEQVSKPTSRPTPPQEQTHPLQHGIPAGNDKSVVFTGPIVIGFGPEDAARFLQSLANNQAKP